MAEEIKYIPYGLDEISQLELLTALANDLPDFMNKYKWLLKPKNRDTFLKIYSDMVNGLTGASNDSGLWSINTSNDLNSYLTSPREKEIAEHAAYYIQLQMAKITPRKKEEENKDAEPFNFVKDFNKSLLNYYGGNPELFKDPEQGWDAQDARGADGLRGIDKRRSKMIEALKNYKDSLTGKNYNFEGTSFKDLNDAQTKIQAAIDALGTVDNTTDDLEAFNALGLPYRAYFSNGGNDPYTKGDYTGTYSGYNEYLAEQNKAKQKAEQEKLKLQRANQYDGYKYYDLSKFNGRPLTALESTIEHLNNIIAKEKWTGDEASQIRYAFKLAEKNGVLEALSKEELALFSPMWKNRTRHLRKIKGINGLYYDTISGKYLKPYKNGQTSQISFLDVLNLNSPEAVAKNKELAELKKIQLANNRKLGEFGDDWKTEDYLRMGAMAQDITGAVTAWVPGYGTAISGGLGLTSLGTNLAADVIDDSLTKWDVAKNAGVNLGLGIVGMVPGLGLASRTGKWITTIAKWAPRLLTLLAIKDLPDSYNSLQKAINNPKELTNADWKNIAYGLSVVAGLSRGAKGYVNNRKFKPAFSESTEKQYTITTSKGKKTLTLKLVDEIKKLNPKDKEKYLEEVKKTLGLEKDETISTKDWEFLGKNLKSNGIKIKEENVPVGLSSKAKAYREYLENQNAKIKENHLFLSKYLNTDYDIYKANTQRSAPNLAISDRIKNIWNPLSDRNLQRKGIVVNEEAPKTLTLLSKWSEIEKGPKKWSQSTEAKEYREMLKGNYSSNAIQGGTHKIGDMTFDVEVPRPGATNGFVEVTFKNGNKETIRFDTQKQLLERISKIIKDNRVLATTSGKTKIDAKEMGKILKSLKARGLLKHGGKVEPSLDTIIEDFIKNNNI